MKIAIIIVIALGAIWIGLIKYEERTRVPVAMTLIDKKMQELKVEGFDNLAGKVGAGSIDENTTIKGVTYSLRYAVIKMGAFTDLRKATEQQLKSPVQPGETIKAIDIVGYVDCMDVIPFGNFKKIGPSFILTIQKETEE